MKTSTAPQPSHSPAEAAANTTQGFQTVRMALHALVRLAISQGITQQALSNLTKRAYFEEGLDYAPLGKRNNSDSRISVLTGLSRRDIRAMREAGPAPALPAVHLNVRIANRWSEREELIDEQGARRRLPRTRAVGGEQSWEALIESVSQEVRPRAVLDEWLRLQLAVVDEQDCVVYVDQEKATRNAAADDLALHSFGAGAFNFLRACARRFETALSEDAHSVAHLVWGYGLTQESAQKIYTQANAKFRALVGELNRLVLTCETLDRGQPGSDQRVFVTLFARHLPMHAEAIDPLTQTGAATHPES
jgi:Family of unknown function (DUF6502)